MVNVDDPYLALNLPSDHTASEDDIKSAYRQLAKKYHPDTWSSPFFSDKEKQNATIKFQKLSAAYELLSDKDKKAEYDRNYKLGLYNSSNRDDDDDDDDEPSRNNSNSNSNNSNNNQSSDKYTPHPRREHTNNNASKQPPPPPVKPPVTGAPPPLRGGWTTAIDPASGCLYYCHAASGRSSWNHPSMSFNDDDHSNHSNKNYYYPRRGANSSFSEGDNGGRNNPSSANYRYYGNNPYNNSNNSNNSSTRSQQSQNNKYDGFDGKRRFPPFNNNKRRRRSRRRGNNNASRPPDEYHAGYYVRTADNDEDDPDNHRCIAFLALLLCPPLGIPACYHSIMVDRCWNQHKQEAERNENAANSNDNNDADQLAHEHSKIAASYACFGNIIGILFWGYILFFREREGEGGSNDRGEWMKDWKFDEWWDNGP